MDPMEVAEITSGDYGKPTWCINCAAYTQVDKAEVEKDKAMAVNGLAPGYIGRACSMAGIKLLHVSTDFVFDGESESPYTEDQHPNPIGVYGRSKRQGEEAVMASGAHSLICRTSWLYGPHGNSFPRTMIKAWEAGKQLRVVSDQIGTPTYTRDLARVLVDMIVKDPEPGFYHAAGPDIVSWHEFAVDAIRIHAQQVIGSDESIKVTPITTADWPTPAKRPKYSALSFEKTAALGIQPMRHLPAALADFVKRQAATGR